VEGEIRYNAEQDKQAKAKRMGRGRKNREGGKMGDSDDDTDDDDFSQEGARPVLGEFGCQVRQRKFEIYNAEWLEALAQEEAMDANGEEEHNAFLRLKREMAEQQAQEMGYEDELSPTHGHAQHSQFIHEDEDQQGGMFSNMGGHENIAMDMDGLLDGDWNGEMAMGSGTHSQHASRWSTDGPAPSDIHNYLYD